MVRRNLLIIHGGGPTAVINASLYGVLNHAIGDFKVGTVFGAAGGTGGLLEKNLVDLTSVSPSRLQLLLTTPGSAIGTSRDHLEPEQYEAMAEIIHHHNIGWVLCNGGNGSMDMCGKLYAACRSRGYDIGVMGIPKTIDNDLAVTDHSPGFGSAARYVAASTQELCADVNSLPIHVVIMEALGRNAGWLAASSALAGSPESGGPDLIYLPERPFSEADFLRDVEQRLRVKKGLVVVVSEGLSDAAGNNIVPPIFQVDRSVYFGDVSAHLAGLILRELGYKARSEKPGLLGRASITLQSLVDREEAVLAGRLACQAVLEGDTGKMVAFKRLSSSPYVMEPFLVDIQQVMLEERTLPEAYINAQGNGVTDAFLDWCRPLIGPGLPEMVSLH